MCFLVVMRKEKSLEYFQDHLWAHTRPAWMERLQQRENYAVYWERHGNILKTNSANVSHPVDFPAATFTCRDTSCPLFYLPKVNGSQHPIPSAFFTAELSWNIWGNRPSAPSHSCLQSLKDVMVMLVHLLSLLWKVIFDVLSNKDPATFFGFLPRFISSNSCHFLGSRREYYSHSITFSHESTFPLVTTAVSVLITLPGSVGWVLSLLNKHCCSISLWWISGSAIQTLGTSCYLCLLWDRCMENDFLRVCIFSVSVAQEESVLGTFSHLCRGATRQNMYSVFL